MLPKAKTKPKTGTETAKVAETHLINPVHVGLVLCSALDSVAQLGAMHREWRDTYSNRNSDAA